MPLWTSRPLKNRISEHSRAFRNHDHCLCHLYWNWTCPTLTRGDNKTILLKRGLFWIYTLLTPCHPFKWLPKPTPCQLHLCVTGLCNISDILSSLVRSCTCWRLRSPTVVRDPSVRVYVYIDILYMCLVDAMLVLCHIRGSIQMISSRLLVQPAELQIAESRYPGNNFLFRALVIDNSPIINWRHNNGVGRHFG